MIAGFSKFLPLLLLAACIYGQEKAPGPQKMQHLSFPDQETGYSKTFLNGILNIKSAMLVRDKSCFTRDSSSTIRAEKDTCSAKSKNKNNESTTSSASCWPTSMLLASALEHEQQETETERQLRDATEEFQKMSKYNRKAKSPVNDNILAVQDDSQSEGDNENRNQNVNQQPKSEGILNALKAHFSGTFNALANGTGSVGDNNPSINKSRRKKSKKHPRRLNSAKYVPRKMSRKHRRRKPKLSQKKHHIRRENLMDDSCIASPIDKDTCQKP